MRIACSLVAVLMALPLSAQDNPPKLNLIVVEGEGAINNIRQRTAREPIIQVEDENHKPVAGAAVVFTLPTQGAGGTFAGGSHTLTVVSDSQGRAVARGFRPNHVQGQYQLRVNASSQGRTGSTSISQSNAVVAGAATTAAATGISTKLIVVIAVAAAAATGGALYATHNGGNNNTTPALVTVAPGTGTVGPPR